MTRRAPKIAACAAVIMAAGGCMVGPDYQAPEAAVTDARDIQPAIDQADARTAELRTLADALQQHGSDFSAMVDQRLAEFTADFERKLDDHHERLLNEQIAEQQSFADAVSRQKQNHLDQLQRDLTERRFELQESFGHAGQEAERRAMEMVEEAMGGSEQKMLEKLDALRVRFEESLGKQETHVGDRLTTMQQELTLQADDCVNEASRRSHEALDKSREQVIQAMSRADDVTRTLKQRLDKAVDEHRDRYADLLSNADDDLLVRSQKLDERLAGLADLFDHQADQIINDLKERANRMLDGLAASLKTPIADAAPATDADSDDDAPQLKVA